MPFRKLMLRVMLWSLLAAAILGTIAIFANALDIIGRVAGTTMLTAFAAAVLMLVSLLMDRPAGRAAGLLGMGVVLVSTLLGLLLIWELTLIFPVTRPDEAVGLTLLATLACGIPAVLLLWWQSYAAARLACRVGLATDAACYVLLLIPAWAGGVSWSYGEVYESAAALAALAPLAVAGLVNTGEFVAPRLRSTISVVRYVGAGCTGLALSMALVAIWQHIHSDSGVFTMLASTAAVIAVSNLTLLAPLHPSQEWVRIGTIGAAVVSGIGVDIIAFHGWETPPDLWVRVSGAGSFITCCGCLALIVFARINRRMLSPPRDFHEAREITLVCPACDVRSRLPVGESACPNCRVRFQIRVEEPRCADCGYLLFMLRGDRCPECGAALEGPAEAQAGSPRVSAP